MRRRRRSSPECVPRLGEPRLRPLEELVRLPRRSELHDELARGLAAASRLHLVRTNLAPVPVRTTATTSEAGAYRFREREPIDLRVSRRSGRAACALLHELGHLVDHQLGWGSHDGVEFEGWRAAVRELERRPFRGRRTHRYFHSARELWARSYAQTALLRSSDPLLEAQLAELQAASDVYVWPADAFEPVALEVERTLERLGLTQLTLPLSA
jgi:hypothetical protein